MISDVFGLHKVGIVRHLKLLFLEKDKRLKRFGLISTAYAAFFILAYVVVRWIAFWRTMFIWENIFIYLFLVEIWLEGGRSIDSKE